jgi:hypothetical protein
LGATSYLCLALLLAEPGTLRAADLPTRPAVIANARAEVPGAAVMPTADHYFFGFEGGAWFNRAGTNLTFDPDDRFFANLPGLKPGGDASTFEARLGRTIGPQWDWVLGFRDNLSATSSSNVVTNVPIIGVVGPAVLNASASDRFSYQQFDAELGYRPPMWQAAGLRAFIGPRIVTAHNRIGYAYDEVGDSAGGSFSKLGNFQHDIDLWGIGPRAGLEASVPLFGMPAPVSLDLTGSGSVIFSHVKHDFDFGKTALGAGSGPGPDVGSGSSFRSTSPTVYNLEESVALGYHISDSIVVQGGYRATQWYNLATTINLANKAGSFQEGRTNVLEHGPFGKITIALPY